MGQLIDVELTNWVKELNKEEMNPYERTMLNILLQNSEEIAKVGTAAGKRAKLLAKIIKSKNCTTDNEIVENNSIMTNYDETAGKIKSLKVESFRGFTFSREFDFSKQYSLFYGPNGSGKSSLTEALEYGLLGMIEEADSRNIKVEKYIKNTITGKGKKPILLCSYSTGDKEAVPDLEAYKFSFIEKNRIDKFSHIDASRGKSQSERIAALFGMSNFNDFVREFTDSFDGRYIKLEAEIKEAFEKSKGKYDTDKQRMHELEERQKEVIAESVVSISKLNQKEIDTMDKAINYVNGDKGILTQLLVQKNEKHIDEIENGKVEYIIALIENILLAISNVADYKNKLANVIVETNFESLYEAIVRLEVTETCPACGTLLTDACYNPYDHAKEQLGNLKHLKAYRNSIESNSKEAYELCLNLEQELEKNKSINKILEIDSTIIAGLQEKEFVEYNNKINLLTLELKKFMEKNRDLSLIKEKVKIFNENTKKKNEEYDLKIKMYSEILENIQKCKVSIESNEEELKRIKDNVLQFEANNKAQIEAIEHEKIEIQFNEKMREAYENLRRQLVVYNSQIPLRMARNLSAKVTEYYNIINNDDADFEKVKEIELPNSTDERITITFLDGTRDDALQVLSEGHIKILGLSILLAKCNYEKMKFIIFDDIVNAIDDDHRDGVAELLINHQDFREIQVILTCHGDQFITKLEDKLGPKRLNDVQRFLFIPADSLEERGVVVEYTNPKYPLKVAEEKYKINELKDAASKCRQALECITNNLWKKTSTTSGPIKVAMRAPKSIPDLASVTDGLISQTKKMDGADEVNNLLVQMKEKYNWMLINKGTHFENEQKEFERSDIKQLIELLKKLDEEVRSIKIKPAVAY